ncbi:MAG TPA: putative lipid II flippase FtsW [Candidatus Fimivivens sp.]|nr:putative lipid II flippase FtsW [Candidatus Fimivivens sp.]
MANNGKVVRKQGMSERVSSSFDRPLLISVFILLGIGLVMVASAGVAYGNLRFEDGGFFFKRQLFGVAVGLVALFFFQGLSYKFWRSIAIPLFFGAIGLLVLVLIPGVGTTAYGAARWIQLGPIPPFQPSEVMKLALVVYFAAWFSGKDPLRKTDFFEGVVPFILMLGIIAFLVMKQPDTGTLGILFVIAMSMFFAAGARLSHIGLLLVSGFTAVSILVMIAPYRMKRFTVFMDPDHDPSGAGYQIRQALIALGSGGLFGVGLGHSRQKFLYLPEPMTDSIFAVLGEELGLVGCTVVIALFLFFAYRGYRIARNAPDEFGRLLAVGIVSWIVFQAFVNIFAITGLMPLTGVPLPLISYGGTSLAAILAAVGILLNVSKHPTMR